MQIFPALDYQRQLIFASLEDFTPNAALPNFMGGQYGTDLAIWRQAVIEFLCVNFHCDLLIVAHYPGQLVARDTQRLRKILIEGDRYLTGDLLWNSLYFYGSDTLCRIMDGYGLRNWEALSANENPSLIKLITEKYSSYGWS